MSVSHLIIRLACLGTLIAVAALNLDPAGLTAVSGAAAAIAGADVLRRRGRGDD